MIGKIEKILMVLIALFSIFFAYIFWQFQQPNNLRKDYEQEEELVILVTFESIGYRKALDELCKLFSEIEGSPKVVIEFVAQSNFQKEICIKSDQNTLPDVLIYENTLTETLVSMNILSDISEYMLAGKSAEFITSGFTSTLVDGKSYGVPLTCDPYVLFYNKELLEQPSKDLSEFYTQLLDTHVYSRYDLGFSIKNSEEIASIFFQMIYGAGGTTRTLNSDNAIKIYALYEQLRDNLMISTDMINWNQNDIIQMFIEKRISSCIMELSMLAVLEEMEIDFTYAIAEVPYMQKPIYLFHGENISVTTSADYEKAISFINFLTSQEQMDLFADIANCLSVRSDDYNNPGLHYGLTDIFVQNQKKYSIQKTTFSTWPMISDSIKKNLIIFLTDKEVKSDDLGYMLYEEVRSAILER
ncbi:MAG: extracellular solute-binding protein [Eubacteriales bacterium]